MSTAFMNLIPRSLALLVLCAGAAGAAADEGKATDALRPSGPVTVTADRAEFDKNGTMIYSGNVKLLSDTLTLSGDKLVLQQYEGGQYEAKIEGNPARLDHAGVAGENGEAAIPVQAQANNLDYDTRNGVIDILGQARMTRDKDEINGDNIRYNVLARRIEAAGGAGGQVKIVIQPPPPKKSAGKKP